MPDSPQISQWRQQSFRLVKPRIFVMTLVVFASAFLGITKGALSIDVFSSLSQLERSVLFDIRGPRVLMTMVTGAGLAMCGLILQAITRNPLADPGIIGVSLFSALFAAIAIFLSASLILPNWISPIFIPAMAFVGALVSLVLLMAIAGYRQNLNTLVLILTGVALNAGAATLLGLIVYLADDSTLRAITFWQLGSYSGISWYQAISCTIFIAISYVYFLRNAKSIMVLQLGEQQARFQGIRVDSLKRFLLVFVALVTALCVCFTGIVGFVGLVVPHITRMIVGSNLIVLLPSSILVGASLVTLADVLARLVVTPAELPIGLLTSALGVPFFLSLILREKRKFNYD
ncbi:iron ABC transporter permease [Alteromonas sp. 5E99-2]|uniref:FecCD family ABC transporter permease n=1 Tax=Alteromonas sp. 5E99-2 TaxID=2817683 RepID=UPI001A9876A5|nr:iron ABC transporter permease [Alteromonas sp. 5E99-2]MBO1255368.1 iron ABC transporter permease [Alteromonas sp. 5E99-2]